MEENERKLAHIEKIEWVREIPGADKICTYGILGWEVVDQKGKYNVGDKVIYCEIDSILPDKPEYGFLKDRKFRIRTIKLKGQVSQGLILSISDIFPPREILNIGQDVTERIGITKYLTPSEREENDILQKKLENDKNRLRKFMMRYSWFRRLFLSRKQKGGFPYWISKTDEERIQSLHWASFYEQFKDKDIYITEKIDYQSATFTGKLVSISGLIGKFLPKKYQFVVCSRNMTTNNKSSLYWKIADKFKLESILKTNPALTIQGEQGDTKVQGNKYKISDLNLWIFNIINHEQKYQYDYEEMDNFCSRYQLNIVPLVKKCKLSDIGETVPEWVEFSKGKSLVNSNTTREGIVVRCIENGKKVFSFKVINPDFLLEYKD